MKSDLSSVRKSRFAVLALFAAGMAVGGWLLCRDVGQDAESTKIDGEEMPLGVHPPRLLGRPAWPDDAPSHSDTPSVLQAGPAGSSRVVLDATGWQEATRLVAFLAADGPPAESETLREVMKGGHVEFEVPDTWFQDMDEMPLTVGLAGKGVKKVVVQEVIERGSTRRIALTVDPGMRLAGRVVNEEGESLRGIAVVARGFRSSPGVKSAGSCASDNYLYSSRKFEEGRARTDEDGRFSIAGLGDHPYFLTTTDLSWAFLPASRPGVRPPRDAIELVATRTYRIRLELHDARGQRPVPMARVRLVLGSSNASGLGGNYHTGFVCREGHADVAFAPVGKRMCEGLSVVMPARIQALGFRGTSTTFEFAPGQHAIECSLALDPVPVQKCHFALWSAEGAPAKGKYIARIWREGDEAYTVALEPGTADGAFHCMVPEGEWACRVFPQGALFQNLVSWEGELSVKGENARRFDVVLPALGALDVSGWELGSFALEVQMAGRRIHTVVSSRSHVYFLLKGTWPYVAREYDLVIQRGVVEIGSGVRTTLVIRRE